MNAKALGALLVGHTSRLRTQAITVALALVSAATLAACSGIGAGNQAPNTYCPNKLAQAAISGSVPGLWNCLTPEFQTNLNEVGVNGDAGLVPQPFASSYTLLGATASEVSYEITLTPQMAQAQGFHEMALVVWLDAKSGKIAAFSTGNSPTWPALLLMLAQLTAQLGAFQSLL